MLKKLSLFVLAFFSYVALSVAAPISPQKAMNLAKEYFKSAQGGFRAAQSIDLSLYRTVPLTGQNHLKGTAKGSLSDNAAFYIINNREGGFVIVAGDDALYPYVAYSDNGNFTYDDMPSHIKAFMDMIQNAVSRLVKAGEKQQRLSYPRPSIMSSHAASVEPLLGDIMWNQSSPWNGQTPLISGKHTPVGCVATATSQIMRYHRWPDRGTGTMTYTENRGATHTVNFDTDYDWSLMPANDANGFTREQSNMLAKLCYNVGVSEHMQYGLKGSGTISQYVPTALRKYFRYDKNVRLILRETVTQDQWEDMIRTELTARRPVYYAGASSGGGHAFVCDGYNVHGLYHINWGWGGQSNDYFNLNLLNPEALGIGGGTGGGFNEGQEIIINIKPDREGSSREPLPDVTCDYFNMDVKSAADMSAKVFMSAGPEEYFEGKLTIALTKVGSTDTIYSNSSSDLKLSVYQLKRINFPSGSYFGHIEDGTYKIFPVVKTTTSNWYRPFAPVGRKQEVVVTFSNNGANATVESDNIPLPDIEVVSSSVESDFFSFAKSTLKFKIENKGNLEFYNDIEIVAVRDAHETVISAERILVPKHESKDLDINIDKMPFTPGEVSLELRYKINNYDKASGVRPMTDRKVVTIGDSYRMVKASTTPTVAFAAYIDGGDPSASYYPVNRNNFRLPDLIIKNVGNSSSKEFLYSCAILYYTRDYKSHTIFEKNTNTCPGLSADGELVIHPFENEQSAIDILKSEDVRYFYVVPLAYNRSYKEYEFVTDNYFRCNYSEMNHTKGYDYIQFETARKPGEKISIAVEGSGNAYNTDNLDWIDLNNNGKFDEGEQLNLTGKKTEYTIQSPSVKIYTTAKVVDLSGNDLTSLNLGESYIISLDCSNNKLEKIRGLRYKDNLTKLVVFGNKISSVNMTSMISDLNDIDRLKAFIVKSDRFGEDQNEISQENITDAMTKHWNVYKIDNEGNKVPYSLDAKSTFKVSLSSNEFGSIKVKENVNLNKVESGTTLTIVDTPKSRDYELASLTANGKDIMTTKTFTVEENTEVKAVFKKKTFKVTLTSDQFGSIKVKENVDLNKVEVGTTLTIVDTPISDDYALSVLTANGKSILSTRQFTVDGDTEVKAAFSKKGFEVKVEIEGDGTVKFKEDVNLNSIPSGTVLHVIATPKNEYYKLDELTCNGTDIMQTMQFEVKGNTVVKAKFSKYKYSVTLNSDDNGSIEVVEKVDLSNVEAGTELTIKAVPKDTTYYLATLKANGEDILKTMKFTVRSNTNVAASFDRRTYKVTLQSNEYGEISLEDGIDPDKVVVGTKVKVNAVAKNKNCKLTSLTANGTDILETKSYVINEDVLIVAVFTNYVATEEIASGELRAYPNPATEFIIVKGFTSGNKWLRIYDLNGRSVYSKLLTNENEEKINVSNLPAGTYILEVDKQKVRILIK